MRVNVTCAEPNVRPLGWSGQELALLSRAAKRLSSGGLRIETDYGLTDEGEPWLVFCDSDSGDVCGHFARLSDGYVACVPFREPSLHGSQLRDVLCRFLRQRGITWSRISRPLVRHADRLVALGFAILQVI